MEALLRFSYKARTFSLNLTVKFEKKLHQGPNKHHWRLEHNKNRKNLWIRENNQQKIEKNQRYKGRQKNKKKIENHRLTYNIRL